MGRLKILILFLLLITIGCGPSHHLSNGYTEHNLFGRLLDGDRSFPTERIVINEIQIYIVDAEEKMPCFSQWDKRKEISGCQSGNKIYVKGIYRDGKYIIPPAVIGHELIHILEGNSKAILPVHQYDGLK